jgi:hypothetical protein
MLFNAVNPPPWHSLTISKESVESPVMVVTTLPEGAPPDLVLLSRMVTALPPLLHAMVASAGMT